MKCQILSVRVRKIRRTLFRQEEVRLSSFAREHKEVYNKGCRERENFSNYLHEILKGKMRGTGCRCGWEESIKGTEEIERFYAVPHEVDVTLDRKNEENSIIF